MTRIRSRGDALPYNDALQFEPSVKPWTPVALPGIRADGSRIGSNFFVGTNDELYLAVVAQPNDQFVITWGDHSLSRLCSASGKIGVIKLDGTALIVYFGSELALCILGKLGFQWVIRQSESSAVYFAE
jgi:hypothetical protein